MPVAVRKTILEDAEILAQIWLESLQDNEMVKLASPEGITPKRLEGATKRTLADLEDPSALCLTAYDEKSGTVMGCAVWRYYPSGKSIVPEETVNPVEIAAQAAIPTTASITADLDSASNRIFLEHVGNGPHAGMDQFTLTFHYKRYGLQGYLHPSTVQAPSITISWTERCGKLPHRVWLGSDNFTLLSLLHSQSSEAV